MKTQAGNVSGFLATFTTSRWIALFVFVVAFGGSVLIDALTPFWVENPMEAHFVAGIVLLGIGAVVVDTWIDYRSAQTWAPVAAFALEDLGAVARAVWVRNASLIQPYPRAIHVEQLRDRIRSGEGADQQRAAMKIIAEDRERRTILYNTLYETAKRTRELIIKWAPVMVSQSPLAEHLSQLSNLHRQIVRTLLWLHYEQAGEPLSVTPTQLCDQVLAINRFAEGLDRYYFAEAGKRSPLMPSDRLISEIVQ
jgi:hypothetical protein